MSTPTEPAPGVTRQQSIKRRVVRLVLIPSLVAVLLWFVASGYLVFQGYYNREVANTVRKVSIPAVSALSSVQQERRLSVAYLARPSGGLTELLDQRRQTDQRVADLRTVGESALGRAPDSIKTRWKTLTDLLDQLPANRSAVDARTTSTTSAYAYYNQVLDASTDLFDAQARGVPDVTATQGGLTATDVFRASDEMSRAGSMIDGALTSAKLGQSDYLEYVSLVGAYHSNLTYASVHLEPGVRQRYTTVQQSDEWHQLLAAENSIIAAGSWKKGAPNSVLVTRAQWTALTGRVSDDLIGLTVLQADQVSARTLRTGNNQLLTASLGSLLALLIAGGAILWAVRQSRVLVDRALSTRLAKLGTDADALVDERLPALMDRLRRREAVDLSAEFRGDDYGHDEIGQVARVINRSLQAAAGAAVNEAKARAAGTAMLMGVARRPQRPLQRGLKVVEDLQGQIGDEKLLTNLFDIHHQLNQTRRFLENLVILAGGQIGRRFQNPVPLRRVMLASFAEARDYQRITLRGAPDVALVGHAVAEVIHLVAELLDNALAFSSPGSTVWVSGSKVSQGVAVEIEDAGVGMSGEAVEQANLMLATAPTPDITELKDGAQVGLHVVAELAKREGVQVSLRRSAYGGLLAIVLLPDRLLSGGDEGRDPDEPLTAAPAPVAPPRNDRFDTVEIATVENRTAVGVLEPEKPRTRPEPEKKEKPAAGRPPLPHRRPQQHLAPGLLEDTGEAAVPAEPAKKRSPEEARARFVRYQQGRTEGRAATSDESATDTEQGRNP
ncbi:nitrate- and nitrite sensing domain-containing protein [Actinoplanes sp. TBRC 11911]|uniref:sensor histidine kinase n=1 Tax=Actinoplanes sp. TBRC 11911 TaxID=2729386 RepID=UPI0028A1628D|nr:nitrate- and nitrite sensing domain-containing protein [Actinoplanes sp. TBRC 11911]